MLFRSAKPVPIGQPVANVKYPALKPVRLAEPFERLRDVSDRILAGTGARPRIFLANLGTVAEFTARATFAKTFFEAGGIEAVSNDGFALASPPPMAAANSARGDSATDLAAMIAAFQASGAKLACLCSSDAVYARHAIDAAKALIQAGATHIYMAGRPNEPDALQAAGVGTFIFAGCDALAALRVAHTRIAS